MLIASSYFIDIPGRYFSYKGIASGDYVEKIFDRDCRTVRKEDYWRVTTLS